MVALTFLDLLLMFAVVPLLPVWEDEIGLTKTYAGLVLGAYSGATLLASIPAGRLADRIGPRWLTLGASLLLAVSAPLLGVADAVWELIALRFAQGLAFAIAWSAGLAWLAGGVGRRAPGARSRLRERGRRIRGYRRTGARRAHRRRARPRRRDAPLRRRHGRRHRRRGDLPAPPRGDAEIETMTVAETLRRGLADVGLRVALVGIVLVAALQTAVQVLGPLHLDDEGLGQAAIGYVFVAAAICSASSAVVIGRRRIDRPRWIVTSLAGAAGLLVVLAAGPPVPVYIVGIAVASVMFSATYAAGWPLGSERAEALGLGQGLTMGTVNSAWSLTALVVPITAGALASATSDRVAYLLIAGLGAAVLAVLAIGLRRPTARSST